MACISWMVRKWTCRSSMSEQADLIFIEIIKTKTPPKKPHKNTQHRKIDQQGSQVERLLRGWNIWRHQLVNQKLPKVQ